jgi:hypothetical protein
MNIARFNKASIAAVVGTLGTLAMAFGFPVLADPTLQAAIVTILTTALVYLVPNSK